MHALLLLLALVTPAVHAAPAPRADSLAIVLRARELHASSPRAAGEAALLLGRLHYARGDYRPAADAFARAAARLDPARKSEALYWAGLSWLALGSPDPARALLEEVAASSSLRRADAQLGIATAWEQSGRPDRAYDALRRVLDGEPGEAGPAALERLAVLADRLNRPADAEHARARLLVEYPSSFEAAMATASLKSSAESPPTAGPVALEGGRFANAARAKALVARATRARFNGARVVERGSAAARTFVVVLGSYPDAAAARQAQARAARELGVTARITGER